MESTASDYNYDYDGEKPVEPCSSDGENLLGAQLSTIYYFMFLFSLFGNGLVLVIIHRWVDKQNSQIQTNYWFSSLKQLEVANVQFVNL